MAYFPEHGDLDPEFRYGVSANQVMSHYPKAASVGPIAVSTPSVSLYRPGETSSFYTTTPATTLIGSEWHRVWFTFSTADTAVYPLGENYRAVWSGVYAGLDGQNEPYYRSTIFSIVREPYNPVIGSSDLAEEDINILDVLARQIALLNSSLSAADFANVIAAKAWSDVKSWIRVKLAEQGRIYPRLIMDPVAIRPVIIARAMARIYRAEGVGGDGETAELMRYWEREAMSRFKAMPEMQYDSDDDGDPDTALDVRTSTIARRSW